MKLNYPMIFDVEQFNENFFVVEQWLEEMLGTENSDEI